MTTPTLVASLDGITPLPPGRCAAIKTYLARDVPVDRSEPSLSVTLTRLNGRQETRYRAIFTVLGTRWLWWSRLMLTPEARTTILDDARVEAYAIMDTDIDIGLLELDFREPAADLAFLGLFEHHTGRGLGEELIRFALARAARRGTRRMTVNTCTFDHPAALGFYRRMGFEVQSQAIEIVPDPRLAGLLPTGAAPHVPMLIKP
ncbi:MAG: GNAT family N-acetyltransferase [Proteobacteria bacterium]|nr:GNAT family N-acetyltransferase [Pseudomonadota bacterium]